MVRTGNRCAGGADRTKDGPHHHAPPLGGMGGGGGPRRGAALLCRRPGPPSNVGGLGPEMPFISRHTARPGHGQQGGRVAGRSAVGRRCRPPVPPVLVAVFATFPPAMTGAANAHNAGYTQFFDRFRLGRLTAQIAYNPPSVMRAGQEPAAIAAHQEQRAYMPFTGAALVRVPCLISGLTAAVCEVRRHRRQDEASAACLALPLPFRECSRRPVFFACGECRQVITPDLQPPQGGGEKEGGASCRNGVRKKAGRTAAYGWRARVERAGTGRRRWPPSEARISGREWRAILPGKGVKS